MSFRIIRFPPTCQPTTTERKRKAIVKKMRCNNKAENDDDDRAKTMETVQAIHAALKKRDFVQVAQIFDQNTIVVLDTPQQRSISRWKGDRKKNYQQQLKQQEQRREEEEEEAKARAALLWEPLRAGWTAMHQAARCSVLMMSEQSSFSSSASSASSSSSLPEKDERDGCWWSWILHQASTPSCSSQKFFTARDRSGETCWDVFFQAWLWPSSQLLFHAQRRIDSPCLQECLEYVLERPESITVIQQQWRREQQQQQQQQQQEQPDQGIRATTAPASPSSTGPIRPLDPKEQRVARFWKALELLCRAAMGAAAGPTVLDKQPPPPTTTTWTTTTITLPRGWWWWMRWRMSGSRRSAALGDSGPRNEIASSTVSSTRSSFSVLEVLARVESCPALVGRLALAMEPMRVFQHPLPLHIWTQHAHTNSPLSLSSAFSSVEDDYVDACASGGKGASLLIPLLEAFPQAASLSITMNESTKHETTTTTTADEIRNSYSSQQKENGPGGRFPLQVALCGMDMPTHEPASSSLTTTASSTQVDLYLDPLWRAFPHIWMERDPYTQLPTFALLVLALARETRQQTRIQWKRPPSQGLHEWLDSYHPSIAFFAMDNNCSKDHEMDCYQVTTLFRVLRETPMALLQHHG